MIEPGSVGLWGVGGIISRDPGIGDRPDGPSNASPQAKQLVSVMSARSYFVSQQRK